MLEYGLTPKFWLADVLLATLASIELGGMLEFKKLAIDFKPWEKLPF